MVTKLHSFYTSSLRGESDTTPIQRKKHSTSFTLSMKYNNITINVTMALFIRRSNTYKLDLPKQGNIHDIAVNVLVYDIVVDEFKFQSGYYIYFQMNQIGTGMNHVIPQVMN